MNQYENMNTSLTRFAWLSIATAVVAISLKTWAYWLTGSIGLLSDALESVVNLVAAFMALAMLTIAARPPDEDHPYGHTKAEYFASGVEGALIVVAAATIAWSAWPRLLQPQLIAQPGVGLVVSGVASLFNLLVARVLFRAGRRYHSITLEADAQHLMTDVWTSFGIVIGIGAVVLTGWERLDPLVALLVAVNIIWSGVQLVRRSALGLLDTALPKDELHTVEQTLATFTRMHPAIQFHALRTRQAGARRFVSLHVLVPGSWTVAQGHELLEQIEAEIRRSVPNTTVFTHVEPLEDPISWEDLELDRAHV